jgi:hypothetical protein
MTRLPRIVAWFVTGLTTAVGAVLIGSPVWAASSTAVSDVAGLSDWLFNPSVVLAAAMALAALLPYALRRFGPSGRVQAWSALRRGVVTVLHKLRWIRGSWIHAPPAGRWVHVSADYERRVYVPVLQWSIFGLIAVTVDPAVGAVLLAALNIFPHWKLPAKAKKSTVLSPRTWWKRLTQFSLRAWLTRVRGYVGNLVWERGGAIAAARAAAERRQIPAGRVLQVGPGGPGPCPRLG